MNIDDLTEGCADCDAQQGVLCAEHGIALIQAFAKVQQTKVRLRAERDQLLRLADAARYWRRREYGDLPEGAEPPAVIEAVGEAGVPNGEADLIIEVDRWNATLERD